MNMLSFILLIASAFFPFTTSAANSGNGNGQVVSIFLPFADPQPLVASIISAAPAATTYLISCPSNTTPADPSSSSSDGEDSSSNECGFNAPGITMTAGPSTIAASTATEGFTYAFSCNLDGTTKATCTTSNGGSQLGTETRGIETSVLEASDIEFMPVTVTAGGEKALDGSTSVGATTDGTATATMSGGGGARASSDGLAGTITSATGTNSMPTMAGTATQPISSGGVGDGGKILGMGALGAGMVGVVAAML